MTAKLAEAGAAGGARQSLYWDWNATTPPHPDVLCAMQSAYAGGWANASSQHQRGRAARALIEDTRDQLAACLGLHPRDVLFASCGTEANNLALAAAPALVVSQLDHPSIVRCAERRAGLGVPVAWVHVPASGRLAPGDVLSALCGLPEAARRGAVVTLTAVNHETGVLQDVAAIAALARAQGARVHVDIAQALGKVPLAQFLDADSFSVVAHKLRGPQGIAALGWRGPAPGPLLAGGSQERGLRPGTQSAPLVAGFGAALRRLDPSRYAALEPLRNALERALAPHASVNGAGAPRAPHVSNLSFAGWSGERLVAALDVRGLCVSTGSACSVGTAEPPLPVRAMAGAERAQSALRISLGEDADEAQVARGIDIILQTLAIQSASASRNA